jgi:peptide/nickel transport system substrate-binding protein
MTKCNHRRPKITRREFLRGAAGSALGLAGLTLRPSPATAAAPAAVQGKQDIIMGIGTDVVVMDTRIQQPAPSKSQIMHVLDPAIWPDNEGKPVGVLLTAWQPSTNPPGWRFKIRPGLKFTNGEPVNAGTLKYFYESILNDENKSWVHPDPRTRLRRIKEVRVEDDLTALLVTDAFYRALPIDTYQFPPVPAKYGAEKGKDFGVAPIGSGHYKFVEYRSKSHLRLEANPDYLGNWEGKAKNSTVTFRYLAENATRVAALEAGEVHVIDNVPPDAVERLKRNPNLDVLVSPTTRLNGMTVHCNRPPFNNLKARLAAAHAIDRDGLVKKIMGGMTQVANQPFPPGVLGVGGETFKPYEYDVTKAKQNFRDAGLTNGTKIRVGGPVGRYINDRQVVTAVAGMLAEVGFDPQIEQLEFGTYWPKVAAGEYDLFYVGWSTFGYDPVDFQQVYTGWSADNGGASHFVEHNQRVVELYRLANLTPAQQEAEKHYKELSHLLWDNVPVIQLFYEPNIAGISKRLKGYVPRRDTHIYLWETYLE